MLCLILRVSVSVPAYVGVVFYSTAYLKPYSIQYWPFHSAMLTQHNFLIITK